MEFSVVRGTMAQTVLALRGGGIRARIHLKIDSGMNRQGLRPEEAPAFLESIRGIDELELVGVMTHFACAAQHQTTVELQLKRFLPVAKLVKREWPRALARGANSAATPAVPQRSPRHGPLRRARSTDCRRFRSHSHRLRAYQPALSWRSQVVVVKRVPARRRSGLRSRLPGREGDRRRPRPGRLRGWPLPRPLERWARPCRPTAADTRWRVGSQWTPLPWTLARTGA